MTPLDLTRSLTHRAPIVFVAVAACKGPPARLVAGTADTVVVNSVRPVRIPMQVLDAAGRALKPTGVQYRWASGVPVAVSAAGVVTCTRRGAAVVRASLGPLVTHVVLVCQPVRDVRVTMVGEFVLGDSARELTVAGIGTDGQPVTLFAARVHVVDSTVVTLDRGRVRPLRPGWTSVDVDVAEQRAGVGVTVFEPVRTFEGLRPDQRFVVAPVHLARGEAVRWPLPVGLFSLEFLPGPTAETAPTLAVDGAIMCMPAFRPGVYGSRCLAREPGATVTVAHPGAPRQGPGTPEVVGALALEQQR